MGMNETVNGVEFADTPVVGDVPLVADMSSNFMSRPIEVRKHAAIYAGLQKNVGPAGMAVSIIRDDFATGNHELKFARHTVVGRLALRINLCTTHLPVSPSMSWGST